MRAIVILNYPNLGEKNNAEVLVAFKYLYETKHFASFALKNTSIVIIATLMLIN